MHDLYGGVYPVVSDHRFGSMRRQKPAKAGLLLRQYRINDGKEITDYHFKKAGLSNYFIEMVEQGIEEISSEEMLEKIISQMRLSEEKSLEVREAFHSESSAISSGKKFVPVRKSMADTVYKKPATLIEIFECLDDKLLKDIYNPVMLFFGLTPDSFNARLFGHYQGIIYVLDGIRVPNRKKLQVINKALSIGCFDDQIEEVAERTKLWLKKARQEISSPS